MSDPTPDPAPVGASVQRLTVNRPAIGARECVTFALFAMGAFELALRAFVPVLQNDALMTRITDLTFDAGIIGLAGNFWLGSSKGSVDKDATIASNAKGGQ